MSEETLQSKIFQFTWNEHPTTRRLVFHVPNGGKRSKAEAAKFKAMGLVPGVPDLLFLWKGVLHAFELKYGNGKPSEAQLKLHPVWLENGVKVNLIWDFESFKKIFEKILAD